MAHKNHEHNSAHHVETNTPTLTNNCWQPELLTRGMREGCVVEDAVEHNSWGKSRCERMRHFPNTGGLHRTSRDALLETPTLQNPASWQPELTREMREGSVVEDTNERNS